MKKSILYSLYLLASFCIYNFSGCGGDSSAAKSSKKTTTTSTSPKPDPTSSEEGSEAGDLTSPPPYSPPPFSKLIKIDAGGGGDCLLRSYLAAAISKEILSEKDKDKKRNNLEILFEKLFNYSSTGFGVSEDTCKEYFGVNKREFKIDLTKYSNVINYYASLNLDENQSSIDTNQINKLIAEFRKKLSTFMLSKKDDFEPYYTPAVTKSEFPGGEDILNEDAEGTNNFQEYLAKISNMGVWLHQMEVGALNSMLETPILHYKIENGKVINHNEQVNDGLDFLKKGIRPIILFNSGNIHFTFGLEKDLLNK